MKPKLLWTLVISVVLISASPLQAQLLGPMAPIAPTSNEQCQAFSQQVNEYWARVNQQHQGCLDSHKADRPNEQPGSRTCSRSACQGLHDELYGDRGLTGKTHQQVQQDAVTACYNSVREAQKRQAQAQQEETERKAAQERDEADRKATRAREEEQRERQRIQADRVNAQKAAQKAQVKPSTNGTSGAQPPSSTQPPVETQKPPQQNPEKQKSQEALLAMRAPFENADIAKIDKERKAMGMGSPDLVDPFPGATISKSNKPETPELAAPFSDHADREATKVENGDSEKVGGYSVKGLEQTFDMLKDDVERGKAQMKRQLSYSAYSKYVERADDAISAVSGVTRVIQLFEYGDLGKNIIEAETPQERKQEVARLALQVAKDATSYAFTRDAVKEGVKKVVVRIFPDTVGTYVVEYSSAALAAASITFDSSEAAAPGLLRYEHWDSMSSKQKQVVLSAGWKNYDIKPGSADPLPDDEDFKVLMEQTDKLYKHYQSITNAPQ